MVLVYCWVHLPLFARGSINAGTERPPLPPLTRPPLVLFESFFCPPVLPLHALKSAFVPCCSCFSCLAVLVLLAGSPLHCCSSACQSLNPVLLFLCSDCALLAPFACCLASMSFCLFPRLFLLAVLVPSFPPVFHRPLAG